MPRFQSVHACCPEIDWRPIQDLPLPHSQCSQNKLQIHQNPDLDKAMQLHVITILTVYSELKLYHNKYYHFEDLCGGKMIFRFIIAKQS